MSKKNDKKLCWNCDGAISLHLDQCPYCGVDLEKSSNTFSDRSSSSFTFQSGAVQNPPSENISYMDSPFQRSHEDSFPKSPYSSFQNVSVSEEEWNQTLEKEESISEQTEEEPFRTNKSEIIALLLLLPGVVFFLFGLMLTLFSSDGVLTLKWNQSFAYFYFLGAVPLLFFGWKALR